MTLTQPQARELVTTSLLRIVPDADLAAVGDDGDLRDALELDSLDFLRFAELLSNGASTRIEEEDYPRLTTVGSAVSFLSGSTTPAS
jgi:acyl carrier protein